MDRVWFITGTSSGFGREIARAALDAGDRVVATARRVADLADLADRAPDRVRAVALDVTDPAAVRAAVDLAVAEFERIDVVVNNAGYGSRGALEELSDEQVRAQFDVNVFGVLDVLRAVLPVMRGQRSGRVVQMSSVGGVTATLGGAAYAATKFALEGLSEALALEVAPLGIRVTLVEPGPFRTDFAAARRRTASRSRTTRGSSSRPVNASSPRTGASPGTPSGPRGPSSTSSGWTSPRCDSRSVPWRSTESARS